MSNLFSRVAVLSAIGLMSSGAAFASTSENVRTGADSTNENDVDVDQDLDQDVDNHADINNTGSAEATTGGNSSNRNTGGGEVDSGDADISGRLRNMVNTLESYFSGNFGDVDWDLLNEITGSNSDNENDISVEQEIDLDVENRAELLNALGLFASSGENSANRNTGGGEVRSGDAMSGADVLNRLNSGGGYEAEFGDVHVASENSTTGADSTNENDIDVDQEIDVDVDNHANVVNTISSSSTTGGNESNRNTGGGKVDSGNAEASAKVENTINQGAQGGGVEFSDVHVDTSNKTTGADSTNENDVDVDQDADVDVDNHAEITNSVEQSASTGDNEANRNTGGGEVSTGDATVSIDFSNSVN